MSKLIITKEIAEAIKKIKNSDLLIKFLKKSYGKKK